MRETPGLINDRSMLFFSIQVSLSKSVPPLARSKAYRSDRQPFRSASFSLPPPNRPAGCQSGAAHRKSLVIPFKENMSIHELKPVHK